MQHFIAVALGGALGAVLRYGVKVLVTHRDSAAALSAGFPMATLLVNGVGSFLIGFVFILLQNRLVGHELLSLFLITGVLGGFTTFSAFSLETVQLLQYGLWGKAMLNIIASLVICILAAFVGILSGRLVS